MPNPDSPAGSTHAKHLAHIEHKLRSHQGRWGYNDLIGLAEWAGFSTSQARVMARIGLAESGGDPTSHNPNEKTGDNSYGLWQINMLGQMGPDRLKQFGLKGNDELFDAMHNARAAYAVYKDQGFNAWSTYKNGAWQQVDPQSYASGSPIQARAATSGGTTATSTTGQARVTTAPGDRLTADELASEYQYAAAFFDINPELHALLYGPKGALAEQWTPDKFKSALMNTNWYRTHTDAQRQWAALQSDDPTTANHQLSEKLAQIGHLANQQGVVIGKNALMQMAQNALSLGMTDDELLSAVNGHLQYVQGKHFGGEAGATQDQLQQIAAAYGVPFGPDQIGAAVVRIQNGMRTVQDFQDQALSNAKVKYAAFADQLDKGMTMKDIVDPYVNQMAQTLEVDPGGIDWSKDPTIQKALSVPAAKPGVPPSAMPLWQFATTLKQDPRWLKTDNARNDMMDSATHVLQDMGFYSA